MLIVADAAKKLAPRTVRLDLEEAIGSWLEEQKETIDEGSLPYLEAFVRKSAHECLERSLTNWCSQAESTMSVSVEAPIEIDGEAPPVPLFSVELLQALMDLASTLTADVERQCPGENSQVLQGEFRKRMEIAFCEEFLALCWKEQRRLKDSRRDLEEALSRVAEAQERERRRLAFDIHDGPAQALSSALLQTEFIEDLTADVDVQRELDVMRSLLRTALDEMRQAIRELRPRSLEAESLPDKLSSYVQEFKEKTGTSVQLEIRGTNFKLTSSLQITVFRLIQEALSNIHKHAQAKEVEIRVDLGDTKVRGEIVDDGVGFDSDDDIKSLGSFGLRGMKERVELLQGELDISSRPGKGTVMTFGLPVWRDN